MDILNICDIPHMHVCMPTGKGSSLLRYKKKMLLSILKEWSSQQHLRNSTSRNTIIANDLIFEPPHDKTNTITIAPSEDSDQPWHPPSLIWSESSLSAWRKLGSLAAYWAHCEDSDQTRRMPRLIWVFAERTDHFVGFVVSHLFQEINIYGQTVWLKDIVFWYMYTKNQETDYSLSNVSN